MMIISFAATKYQEKTDTNPCDPCMSIPEQKMRKGMIAVEQDDGSIKTMIVEITEEEYQKIQLLTH